ncbi:nucleotidyltransferase family protein [Mucilaginibacter sp. RS28]|uniref:Nucleotidyltransferase family protein n=1 Tax=Mucilaginibacter straminoryzae TaxID=2932774 RepID=A0A9X1X371_9SPHI|nr:nucleotidyltransferase family protein [Mucilaginibacter straminoryzae]MCJ8209200.1 nucleotidyltransferase family protein [Mucilaginibacter straminoryzae]
MLSTQQLRRRYSAEQTLIILLCRLYFKKALLLDVQKYLEDTDIDWTLFYKSAQLNSIRGFLYDIIETFDLKIDYSVLNMLKAAASTIQQKNLYQLKITRELARDFQVHNIHALSYKGAFFATSYYKKPFLRESSDIDFLVSQRDVIKAIEYFKEHNYHHKYDIPTKYLGYVMKNCRDLSFKTPGHFSGLSCSVEIQWSLVESHFNAFPGYDFFSGNFKKRDGTDVPGLNETYDFICVSSHHLLKEPLFKFKYLVDLACIVNTAGERLDFEKIEDLYLKLGYERFLYAGSAALTDILGIQFGTSPQVEAFYAIFLADKNAHLPMVNRLQLFKTFIKNQSLRQNFVFMIKVIRSVARPNISDLLLNLPPRLVPLLFIIRPVRLMNKYIIKLLT